MRDAQARRQGGGGRLAIGSKGYGFLQPHRRERRRATPSRWAMRRSSTGSSAR
jgi:hypothetical protein